MKSSDLSDFGSWERFSKTTVDRARREPGVYVFRLAEGRTFPRLVGESDLVYIGSSTSLQRRLRDHLRPREDERDIGYRLKRVEDQVSALELAWKTFETYGDAETLEWELLEQYQRDHIEFPPLNRQESGKRILKAKRDLLSLSPGEFKEVLKEAALKLARAKDLDRAIIMWRAAIRLQPDDAEEYNFLGILLDHTGDHEGAIAAYREALRVNPNSENAHSGLGFALKGKGDPSGAVAEYQEALRLNPDLAEAHDGLGRVLWFEGDWDGAIAEFRQAIRLNRHDSFMHLLLGDTLLKKGDIEGAIAECSVVG